MAINLTKTETVPAPLQPHLATFLPLLNKETLIEVVLGVHRELTAAKQDLTETCLSRDAARSELAAMTAEFEEKYYGLDLTNRRLRDTLAKLEERFEKVTMRLAQAEAALGVPADDEWDSWADEANSRREIDRSINQLLLTKTLD